MKRPTISILFLILIFMATACRFPLEPKAGAAPRAESTPAPALPAARPTFAPAAPVLDVRYSDEISQREGSLNLDIYPAAGTDLPVMVFFHGGGWFRGDKTGVNLMPSTFNQHGFVFVSVNYRLVPEVGASQQMQDAARAVAWVKRNIARYGGDSARIFLMGHSAGAHLASLLATDETYLLAEGLLLADIKGCIALDTQAYDLFKLMSNLPPGSGEVYTEAFGNDPEYWKKMSPLSHVRPNQDIPPMLIVYTSQKETRVFFSREFYEALQRAGIPSLLVPAPDKTHGQIQREFGAPNDRVSGIVFDWLQELLQ